MKKSFINPTLGKFAQIQQHLKAQERGKKTIKAIKKKRCVRLLEKLTFA